MLYYQLAESFDELEMISAIVEKVSELNVSKTFISNHSAICRELNRIKRCATADIKIFGLNTGIYVNRNLMKINVLLLKVLERVKSMSDLELVISNGASTFEFCLQLRDHLRDLYHFFEALRTA